MINGSIFCINSDAPSMQFKKIVVISSSLIFILSAFAYEKKSYCFLNLCTSVCVCVCMPLVVVFSLDNVGSHQNNKYHGESLLFEL